MKVGPDNILIPTPVLDLVVDLANPQKIRLEILALSAHYPKSLRKKTYQSHVSDRPHTPYKVIF